MKLKLFVLLVLTTLLLSATPARAAVNVPPELAYIDAQVEVMAPFLQNFQSRYMQVNGRYYQALFSSSTAPDVPTVPSELHASPTDQPEALAYFWDYASLPTELAWRYSIDTYAGADGAGYVLNAETVIDGTVWRKSLNYGPENDRAADWYIMEY